MPPRILYIAGYSRSGSTLVDMVLNSSARIASTGELTYLPGRRDGRRAHVHLRGGLRRLRALRRLAGARPTGRRPPVRASNAGALGQARGGHRPAERVRLPRLRAKPVRAYRAATGAEVVVDSSKSARDAAGRPLALSRLAGLDVRILHLTRDPGQTVQSYVERGSNWVLEGHRAKGVLETWRPIPGWVLANRIARRLGREIGADRYLHLRFEDCWPIPAGALGRIGTFAGADLSGRHGQGSRRAARFHAGHMVGGNRARLTPRRSRPPARAPGPPAAGPCAVPRPCQAPPRAGAWLWLTTARTPLARPHADQPLHAGGLRRWRTAMPAPVPRPAEHGVEPVILTSRSRARRRSLRGHGRHPGPSALVPGRAAEGRPAPGRDAVMDAEGRPLDRRAP
jgi:hypothetical protein